MEKLLQAIVNGIQVGSPYALIALSIVVIFGTVRAVNFAQGSMGALSGFVAYVIIVTMKLPWVAGLAGGIIVAFLIGLAVERGIVRPLSSAPLFIVVAATLGLDIFINSGTLLIFGPNAQALPPPIPATELYVGELHFNALYLLMIGVTAVLVVGLGFFFERTNLGLGLRAYAQNPTAAALMGVPTRTVSQLTWVLAALLGGIAALLLGPMVFIKVGYVSSPFIMAFAAAILGALGSPRGAVAGAFLLGILESLSITYLPEAVTSMMPLIVILVMLLLKPAGLFGKARAERV